jgi:fumarate reductase (CoM/CoB) subunit B
VLKKIPGLKLIEMKRSDACCGAGGALRLTRKDLSDIVAKKKGEFIGESNAQAVVTTCPWCQLNIEEGLQNIPEEKRPKVLNLTEILEMAYK